MTTERDQLLFDTFVTALEGGINYWASCDQYHIWVDTRTNPDVAPHTEDTRGFYAVIIDVEDDGTIYTVNRATMARGLRLAATEWRDKISWSDDKPPLVVTADTDWVPDAGDADAILQLGIFGDVIYG